MNVSISRSQVAIVLPSFPNEILDLIIKEFKNDKQSLGKVSRTCRLFRALVRPYLFHSIVVKTLAGLYELPYFRREVLESIRVLELAFRRDEDLESTPWLGSPLSHLLVALSSLTNLEELVLEDRVFTNPPIPVRDPHYIFNMPAAYPYATLPPSLLVAIQSHPTLHTFRQHFDDESERDDLEGLPACPRPSSQIPLLLPSVILEDPYSLDERYSRIVDFMHRQGFHVDTIVTLVTPHSLDATRTATSLVERSLPSLSTVFLQLTISGNETSLNPFNQLPHFFPRVLARNPSIRTIAPRDYRDEDDPPVFSSRMWKSLFEVRGLEQLANPSLESLWISSEPNEARSFAIGISEEEEGGGRSRVTGAEMFETQVAGRHGGLDIAGFVELASIFPSLEYLALRDPGYYGDDLEFTLSLSSPSLPYSSLLRPRSLTTGLTVILLSGSHHHLYPNLSGVDLPSHCSYHRHVARSSSSTGGSQSPFIKHVLDELEAAGGPWELWKNTAIPRWTSRIEELAVAIPTLRLVEKPIRLELFPSPDWISWISWRRKFVWDVSRSEGAGLASETTSTTRNSETPLVTLREWDKTFEGLPPFRCVCDITSLSEEDEYEYCISVDEWWEDRIKSSPAVIDVVASSPL